MKKALIIGCLLLLNLSVRAQNISPGENHRLTGIDVSLLEVLDTWMAPGCAVAVVEKDSIVYAKGFGYRDYENKLPVTPHTLFAIGSCTKSFTTSLLGILQAEGKIDFNERAQTYLPALTFFNQQMNHLITIKDMMIHRTGLPRHDYSWYLFPSDSRDSLLQRIAFQKPFTGVREKWYYNNFMYMTLGCIAEDITGKTWEENVEERLFQPLAMNRSNLSVEGMIDNEDAAFGYLLQQDSVIKKMDYYRIKGMSPAGSINSSVTEMGNWLKVWINGGKYNDKQVLPVSFIQEAMASQVVVSGELPEMNHADVHLTNYGYGWFIGSYRGHYRVMHGGNINGFSAKTCLFPNDSIGIVVLSNQNASPVPALVTNIVADKMLGLPGVDWSMELKEKQDKAKREMKSHASLRNEEAQASHPAVEYAGIYSHPGYGNVEVVAHGDSLFAQFPLMKFWLKHCHYDVFDLFRMNATGVDTTNSSDFRFNFRTSEAGKIESFAFQIEPMLDAMEFKRINDPAGLDTFRKGTE